MLQTLFTDEEPLNQLSKDLLGRRAFIETLANALLLPPQAQCRVISLEAKWGEGKTTAIEMALDLIGMRDADQKPFVVRVNPWQLGTKDGLVRALLTELSKIVVGETRRQKSAATAKLADELLKYSNALSALKVEPTGWLFATAAQCALRIATRWGEKDLELGAFKDRVSKAIQDAGRPILVVVDDVDRLLPSEVVEVVRFVRAVADFKRTTYLLAYDHARVVEALGVAGVPSPSRFLEKIVQLRTHLPPASAGAIRRILDSKLSDSSVFQARREFDESESRRVELYSFYLAPLIGNVRTLLRVLSRTELMPTPVVREVEFWDVFALNVLSVVSPDLFDYVRAHPERLVKPGQMLPSSRNTKLPEVSDELEQILRDEPANKAFYLKGLLAALFPVVVKTKSASQGWLEHNGRVASERHLLTYLLSGVTEGEVPLDMIRAIISEPKLREDRIAASTFDEDSLLTLVSSLREELLVSKLDVVDPAGLVHALMERLREIPSAESGMGRIDNTEAGMLPLILELIARDDNAMRTLTKVLTNDYAALMSHLLLEELKTPSTEASRSIREVLPDHELAKFIERFAKRVADALPTAQTSFDSRFGVLLFSLRRLDRVRYDEFITAAVNSSNRGQIRALLRALANSVFSSAHGRVAVWKDELIPPSARHAFEEEASRVLYQPAEEEEHLVAAARALKEGGEIVVSTGKRR